MQREEGQESLWLRNVPTGSDTEVLPLSESAYVSLAVSPDGDYIYYRKIVDKTGMVEDVFRTTVLGGTPQPTVRNVDTNVTFSPDGTHMVYARWEDPAPGKYRLLFSRLDGRNLTG